MNSNTPDDQDLLDMRRLAEGHELALDRLMERHAERLFHYLVRSLQNQEDAADLAQETFVRVYQHRASFNGQCRFLTWLYTIANNLIKDCYRWRSRHPQVSLDAESGEFDRSFRDRLPSPQLSPREAFQVAERAAEVREALAGLPEDLRQPLILAEYEDLSYLEISSILGCSVKAVETRIYRARKQLRAALSKSFGAAGSEAQ